MKCNWYARTLYSIDQGVHILPLSLYIYIYVYI